MKRNKVHPPVTNSLGLTTEADSPKMRQNQLSLKVPEAF